MNSATSRPRSPTSEITLTCAEVDRAIKIRLTVAGVFWDGGNELRQLVSSLRLEDRVELRDRKFSHAALRAAWPAQQPGSALPRGLGKGCIHDLDQAVVALHTLILPDSSPPHGKRRYPARQHAQSAEHKCPARGYEYVKPAYQRQYAG